MSVLKSKWFLLLIIPLIAWLSIALIKINLQKNIVNRELGSLEAEAKKLESDNAYLAKIISYLSHPGYLETQSKVKLNYRQQGESVAFVYTDDKNKISSASVDFMVEFSRMPNPVKWAYYLMGY